MSRPSRATAMKSAKVTTTAAPRPPIRAPMIQGKVHVEPRKAVVGNDVEDSEDEHDQDSGQSKQRHECDLFGVPHGFAVVRRTISDIHQHTVSIRSIHWRQDPAGKGRPLRNSSALMRRCPSICNSRMDRTCPSPASTANPLLIPSHNPPGLTLGVQPPERCPEKFHPLSLNKTEGAGPRGQMPGWCSRCAGPPCPTPRAVLPFFRGGA